jgi:hypothetical protein
VQTKHGEIDDTLHEVDTGVGDNNSYGVFDGGDHDAAADDDFDYQELLSCQTTGVEFYGDSEGAI